VRGCLGVLVLAAAAVLAAAWFGAPRFAGVLVEGALDVAGLEGRNRSVRVESDPPIEILGGRADRVVIRADDVVLDDLDADSIDVTLLGVDLVGRTFGRIDGRLDAVVLTAGDGTATEAQTVELVGPADDVLATVRISGSVVDRLAREAIERDVGLPVGEVELETPSTIAFTIGPARVEGLLAVDTNGALTASLGLPGDPVAILLSPDNPFRLTAVSVDGADLVLIGRLDLASLLR
jgi:hypothetical protein